MSEKTSSPSLLTNRKNKPASLVSLSSEALAEKVHYLLDHKKAENIKVLNLKGQTPITDYVVIATGTSSRHLGALIDTLQEAVRKEGISPLSIEGYPDSEWMLLDLNDVIIHLFTRELRSYYALEELWKVDKE